MKLIREITESLEVISEGKEPGSTYIAGPFMQYEVKNRNGRFYPKETLIREVARYNETYVNQKRALGELGHPQGPTINLDRVSHMITELKDDGKCIYGKAKILDTPNGKIVKEFINQGIRLGVSSRGMGTLKNKKGYAEVQDDFFLATAADIVADPSAPEAFVEGIMEEAEWIYVDGQGWICEYADKARKVFPTVSKEERMKFKVNLFEDFMKRLSKKSIL